MNLKKKVKIKRLENCGRQFEELPGKKVKMVCLEKEAI